MDHKSIKFYAILEGSWFHKLTKNKFDTVFQHAQKVYVSATRRCNLLQRCFLHNHKEVWSLHEKSLY
ncbi:hypothetical protein CANARDRAFT_29437 [[Candida] arabinofermentans NRRL YB-2248]|uniref:Uncharacterized protein n=1 Tax=[Candida] arabinofermentans NRRL YB-2248 TaxID=983967 RepID=A0A1E4SWU8_9ASCO|nr:hypothetical protein CANARDRAFT_29437 [[Candida] arabinofermentans NRRL YB-2248]